MLQQLAYDPKAASSISGSLAAARSNARSARDAVSSELWEALNLTFLRIDEQCRRARRTGPHLFFQWVRERTALVAGTADSTMSRDEGWLFLVLGRSIERVDMTARLITTRAVSRAAGPSWPTLLRSCGAYEAYLRTYRGRVSERTAAEFLLLDRLFPRSMFFALSAAEECLGMLDNAEGRLGSTDQAHRLLGRARTGLEYRGVDEMLSDLTGTAGIDPAAPAPRQPCRWAPVLPARGASPGSERAPDESANRSGIAPMTWRVRVRHRTGYSYDGKVKSSYNEARLTPLTDPNQTTLDSRLEISPSASTYRYRDYWGNRGDRLRHPHTAFRTRGGGHQRGGDLPAAVGARRAGLD